MQSRPISTHIDPSRVFAGGTNRLMWVAAGGHGAAAAAPAAALCERWDHQEALAGAPGAMHVRRGWGYRRAHRILDGVLTAFIVRRARCTVCQQPPQLLTALPLTAPIHMPFSRPRLMAGQRRSALSPSQTAAVIRGAKQDPAVKASECRRLVGDGCTKRGASPGQHLTTLRCSHHLT